MKQYNITEMIVFPIGYLILSIVFLIITGNFISIWLGINIGLAMVPMIIISYIYRRMEQKEFAFDWVSIVLLIVFIFFFPNTFYVITDMIHLGQIDFYSTDMYQPTEYFRNIESYLFLCHVVLTVFIGVYAGIKSMLRFDSLFEKRNLNKGTRDTFLYVLVVLSAIGIYIGRFLRFFSWDILSPLRLMNELIESLDVFALLFIILFGIMQISLYYGYLYLHGKEPL